MENPEKPNGKKLMDEFVSWIEEVQRAIKKDPDVFVEMRKHFASENRRSQDLHRKAVLCSGADRDLIQEASILNRRVGLMEILLASLE